MTDDLTNEQLDRIIANHESGIQLTGVNVYRQLRDTRRREASLREAVKALGPFDLVQGDSINRTNPNSQQKVNSNKSWAVSNGTLPAHKLRRYIEQLNEASNG